MSLQVEQAKKTPIQVEQAIQKFIDVRDQRAELKRIFEENDFRLKEAQNKIEIWLMKKLDADSVEAFKTAVGTAYISKEFKASCADWPNFWDWCREKGEMAMQEKRLSIQAIKDYYATNNELPPFVNLATERVVRVRRT